MLLQVSHGAGKTTITSSPPYLELVDEDSNGIEPIARVGLFGHGSSYRWVRGRTMRAGRSGRCAVGEGVEVGREIEVTATGCSSLRSGWPQL